MIIRGIYLRLGRKGLSVIDYFYEASGNQYFPTEFTIGPWSPSYQHGSPPFALCALVAASEFPELEPTHVELSLVRPISLAPISVEISHATATRRTAWISYSMVQEGSSVAYGNMSLARFTTNHSPAFENLEPPPDGLRKLVNQPWDSPGPALGQDSDGNPLSWINHPCGFMSSSQWKFPPNAFSNFGPQLAWWKTSLTVIHGNPDPPWILPILLADASWSISRSFSFEEMSAVNTGISCDVVANPTSRSLGLTSENFWSSSRNGLSVGRIYDQEKLVATVSQPLLLSPPRQQPVS